MTEQTAKCGKESRRNIELYVQKLMQHEKDEVARVVWEFCSSCGTSSSHGSMSRFFSVL
jgi:hypothetical protein